MSDWSPTGDIQWIVDRSTGQQVVAPALSGHYHWTLLFTMILWSVLYFSINLREEDISSFMIVVVGGLIDIFYNGQCSMKLSPWPCVRWRLSSSYLLLSSLSRNLSSYIYLLLLQVSLMLPEFVYLVDGGNIEWVLCCHLLLNTSLVSWTWSRSQPAMTKWTKRFTGPLPPAL